MSQANMKVSKFSKALQELLRLVDTGTEFPTAHEAVVAQYKLNEAQAEHLIAEFDHLDLDRG